MMALETSPDNRFVAAYTNNNQTVLLNTLISEFVVIDNPFNGKNNKKKSDNEKTGDGEGEGEEDGEGDDDDNDNEDEKSSDKVDNKILLCKQVLSQ